MSEGIGARTIRSHVTLLHSICEYAISEGWLARNPTKGAELPRYDGPDEIDEGPRHAHTQEEVAAVLRACESEFDRALLTTAYYTGMRIGELLAVTWADVDLLTGRINIRRSWSRGAETTTKSRKRREFALAPAVIDALARSSPSRPTGRPQTGYSPISSRARCSMRDG